MATPKGEGPWPGVIVLRDVKEYPNAGHSFLDSHKGLIGMLGVVIGSSYKDKEAADARGRIKAFFARRLA